MIEGLEEHNASVAAENMREHFPDIEYTRSPQDALKGASGCIVCTDWDEFAAWASPTNGPLTPGS